MGNKPVKIGLKLDQTKFEAGSVLTGRVYLSITGGERRAQGVHLLLVGQETSAVAHEHNHEHHSGSNRNTSHVETQVERSTTSLVHLDVPLTTFDDQTVQPGQYEYPFEWELPMDLPGTMRCQKGESFCEVSYQLTSYLYSGSSSLWGGSQSPDASCSVSVCVTAKPNIQQQQHKGIVLEPEEFPIRHCCANKGYITLGWETETAVACPRSAVRVVICGSNSSMVEVKHLKVRWMETVSWNARGQSQAVERILDESIVPITSRAEWHPLQRLPHRGLFSSSQHHGSTTYASLYPSAYASDNHNSSDQQQPQRLASSLNIPPDARDSYQGRLIHVRHSLVVKAVTTGGCCITSPESCALVEVQRQPTTCSSDTVVTATEEFPYGDESFMSSSMAATVSSMTSADATTGSTCAAIVEPSAPHENDVFVQANVLPPDWSAQTTDVITLSVPVGPTSPGGGESPARARVIPTAPPHEQNVASGDYDSMEQLRQSLASSLDPQRLVGEQWISNPTVITLLQNATPHEYVSLLQCLQSTPRMSATPEAARAIAVVMGEKFTCNHVLACLWALPPYLRFDVLKEVAPLASDLEKNKSWMEQQLDSNELLHFRAALM